MLVKLFSKVAEAGRNGRKAAPTAATPDISRVLKPGAAVHFHQPEPAPDTMTDTMAHIDAHGMLEQAEDAVDALADEFDGWMRNDLETLRSAWLIAQTPDATADDYRTLYTCAHNIRGAASSYGYPSVSRLCGTLCTLLSQTRPGENHALINLHIEACRAAVCAGQQGEGSESVADAVCDALERKVSAKIAAAG